MNANPRHNSHFPHGEMVNAEPSAESCRKGTVHYLPDAEWLTNDVAAVTAIKKMIEALLVKTSENGRCEAIATALGYAGRDGLKLALNTVRSVLREQTKSVDVRIGFGCVGMCYLEGIDPYKAAGLPQMAALMDAFYVGRAIAEGRVTPAAVEVQE